MRRLALLLVLLCVNAHAEPPAGAKPYRSLLTRAAHFANGLDAPIPMYAAQIEQESGWRPGITAWDGGKGLAQFMDGTAAEIADAYPALGEAAPFNPAWAIPALVRYDTQLTKRVQGDDDCHRRAAALKAYNAGLGFVLAAQRGSPKPGQWWGVTEDIATKQTAANFAASRLYPRRILFQRQPHYTGWGAYTCEGVIP